MSDPLFPRHASAPLDALKITDPREPNPLAAYYAATTAAVFRQMDERAILQQRLADALGFK